jgi:hypothetical protein
LTAGHFSLCVYDEIPRHLLFSAQAALIKAATVKECIFIRHTQWTFIGLSIQHIVDDAARDIFAIVIHSVCPQ